LQLDSSPLSINGDVPFAESVLVASLAVFLHRRDNNRMHGSTISVFWFGHIFPFVPRDAER
jgi:hypothetical protein